jgi:hypothetical protein
MPRKPWNAGRLIGPKAPLKPKYIWAIRQQLKTLGRKRDLAMFNCARFQAACLRLGAA